MKNKDTIHALLLLFISVCALTIGFAAYTRNLDIINARAEVKPSNSLNVHFPTSGTLTPVAGTVTSSGDVINLNSGLVISNLKAYFEKPGDYIIYETSIINDSSYVAYLKNIDFSYGSAICTPLTNSENPNPASEDILLSVCDNMKLYVTIDGLVNDVSDDLGNITGKTVGAGESVPVFIKISYEGTMESDGDFTANLGDITFHFSSID